MADNPNFTKLVPGFEFLQSLVKNAGSALPNIGHWVAPTLNPDEIEKRIEELRTVKFWLEQNGRMLDATIQALEVQRMTLSTLKTMNVHMGDLRESMMIRPSAPAQAQAQPPAPATGSSATVDAATSAMAAATSAAAAFANAFQFPKTTASSPAPAQPVSPPSASGSMSTPPHPSTSSTPPSSGPESNSTVAEQTPKQTTGVVDPMQWWGALTKQFTTLASSAIQDSVTPRSMASAGQPAPSTRPVASSNPAPRAPAKRSPPPSTAQLEKDVVPARKRAIRRTPSR